MTQETQNSTQNSKLPTQNYLDMDLLRFTTAGSVDDGKSTLIGRMLYDSKSIFQDQMDAIESSSKLRGEEGVNLALLTDGLRAEREQGITIDVAYRYFATPKRKFIIADTPGHIQYTRNMVTGASTADLAIILIDARKGVLTQSRRHAFISSLLQIPHVVVAINKMDLVDYGEERYEEIVKEFREFAGKLDVDDITYIPMSALVGDNIVNKGDNMPWYDGPTLLYHLENVKVGSRRNQIDFRFPVQYVIRPNQDFRGYAGTVASGRVSVGEEVVVLPSRLKSKIKSITTYEGENKEANAGDAVTISIEDEIDISRGDMIVRSQNIPKISKEAEAYICWMNEEPMEMNKTYLVQHTSRTSQAHVSKLHYRINIDSLHREETETLALNEIGRVKLSLAQSIFYDPYQTNNATGSFIVIDPASNVTVAAGMLRGISTSDSLSILDDADAGTQPVTDNVVWEPWNITREEREARNGHKAQVIWLTGISGAGKSTIARALERKLWEAGKQTVILDGDQVRHGLNGDLGFSASDRKENIRRVANTAKLFLEHGNIVICTFVSPFENDRNMAKEIIGGDDIKVIHIHCDSEEAIKRDPKGLYAKAKAGQIKGLTGYDAPFEAPVEPAMVIDTAKVSVEEAVAELVKSL